MSGKDKTEVKKLEGEKRPISGQNKGDGRGDVLFSIKDKEMEASKRISEEQAALEKRIEEARKSAAEIIENAKKAANSLIDKSVSAANLEAATKGKAVLSSAKRSAAKVGKVSREEALSVFAEVVRKKFGIGAKDV